VTFINSPFRRGGLSRGNYADYLLIALGAISVSHQNNQTLDHPDGLPPFLIVDKSILNAA